MLAAANVSVKTPMFDNRPKGNCFLFFWVFFAVHVLQVPQPQRPTTSAILQGAQRISPTVCAEPHCRIRLHHPKNTGQNKL